jgi:prepilin-type N-terminal cleavage/methylation domain-containing protein
VRAVSSSRACGFTLLEILLVLTLVALLGSVLIGGAVSLLKANNEQDPESALLSLLQKVRAGAVESNTIITLQQLPEGGGFLWGESGVETLPMREGGPRALLLRPEFAGASLIAGQLEERLLESMRFYPDGSSDAARVEVRRGDTRRVFAIDPWTAAPLPESPAGGFAR